MASKGEETALGTARGRFIESLPRKAIELRGAIALLTATPAAEGPREDMRRRLHTLYASALVFRNDALALAVKEGIDRLDGARDQSRPLSSDDLDVLTLLVKRIPELRGDEAAASVAPAPAPQHAVSMSGRPIAAGREPRTLLGLQPVVAPSTSESMAPRSAQPRAPQRVDGGRVPVLSRVLNVLVLAPPPVDTELSTALDTPSLSFQVVHTVRAALESARAHAPDVIAADAQLAKAGVLVGSLRGDPLTDFVPVVLLESVNQRLDVDEGRALGADDVLTRPFQAARLVRTLGRVTGTLIEGAAQLALPPQATLEELSNHVAEEIRRGIVDAAETGRNLKVPLGEGAEVLAAAWAAVARVRAFVSQQTAGQVRFSDRALRSGASLLVLGKGPAREAESDDEKFLTGRRILVADDDSGVVWFFAGVLREEGATVIEASDGRDALGKARSERPDAVISDILMPGLDGFALCRELKRDPALADVPVILLSWKEDLLARMRELAAGASAYLRKEIGAAHIIAAVRDVLKPRTELEAQLRASGEVRGNLEGTGVVPLLRSVRRARPDARVTLRDAFNHFECELRDGRLVQLTRTASDGSFTRGDRALPQLLGVNAGRFAVADLPMGSGLSRLGAAQDGPGKQPFEGSLDDVLTRGARELGALLEALAPENLPRVARVVLDEDAYASMLKNATEGVRRLVERLHAGEPPAQLVQREPGLAALLESLLMELARRGAVRGVVGSAGEDLVTEARSQRSHDAPTQLSTPQSIIPPVPNPVISVLRPPRSGESGAADELPSVLDPAAAVARNASERPASTAAVTAVSAFTPRAEATPLPPVPTAPEVVPSAVEPQAQPVAISASEAESIVQASPPSAEAADDEQPTGEYDPLGQEQAQSIVELPEPALEANQDSALAVRAGEPEARPVASQSAQERELRDSVASESELLASDERRSKTTIAAWALALLVLGAIGFVIERGRQQSSSAEVEALGRHKSEPAVPSAFPEAEAAPEKREPSAPPLPQGTAPVVPRDSGFEIYEGILDKSVKVAADQALLIVEATPRLTGAQLSIDGKRVGPLPARVALAEGIHELAIERGDAVAYRFVSLHAGRTWKLREP